MPSYAIFPRCTIKVCPPEGLFDLTDLKVEKYCELKHVVENM